MERAMGGEWHAQAAGIVAAALAASLGIGTGQAAELTCQDPFSATSDHSRLVSAFGKDNVAWEAIPGPEGTSFEASVIFPKDPARRIEVVWWDEKVRRRPATVRVRGSAWTGPGNVRVGMTLKEAADANGRPFSLYGFGWDYGGTVSGWKGGALAKIAGGCTLAVRFEADERVPEAALLKVSSDREFSSANASVVAVKPRIWEFGIGYPEP
jgi:hypothetical protein